MKRRIRISVYLDSIADPELIAHFAPLAGARRQSAEGRRLFKLALQVENEARANRVKGEGTRDKAKNKGAI